MPKMTDEPIHSYVTRLSTLLAEGKNWAVKQFIKDNPNRKLAYMEVCELQGNPFGYYIRCCCPEDAKLEKPMGVDTGFYKDSPAIEGITETVYWASATQPPEGEETVLGYCPETHSIHSVYYETIFDGHWKVFGTGEVINISHWMPFPTLPTALDDI